MKPTVYIETTIPSFYFNSRTEASMVASCEWTRDWWDNYRHDYNLVTGAAVIEELSQGRHPHRAEKLALLNGLTLLPANEEVNRIAKVYIACKVMPDDPKGDALHLALASVYKCDILLSWNCRHIVNYQKSGHVRRLNTSLGLHVPALLTPLELLNREMK
jgi:hypothetical protein